jgi:RimJ/RimL family protein N-acetyltransferase
MKKNATRMPAFRTGKTVILRPVMEEDVPLFFEWMNDPEVTQYMETHRPVTLSQEQAWFERVSKIEQDSVTLVIVVKKTKACIGCISISKINSREGTAITGTVIGDKRAWGKGYGSEAKMLLLDHAFNDLNLRKIYSYVIGYNDRSLAYARRCGYVEEARIPNHFYRKGKYWEQIILAVYREAWEALVK